MNISVFGEGATEEKVCKKIAEILGYQTKYKTCQGKGQLNKTVINTIRPLPQEQEQVCCVVLRDLDRHEGETAISVLQGISDALRRAFNEIDPQMTTPQLAQHSTHINVYTLQIPDWNFYMAVHFATRQWHENFIKSTIDDYVLELALRPNTVANLAERLRIDPIHLATKITDELPDLLHRNGITLTEAKDYVRLYAAIAKLHTSPPVFAEKTMANAVTEDILEIFQPLIAAFEFVRGE